MPRLTSQPFRRRLDDSLENYKVRRINGEEWETAAQNAINKLGRLEDLEEELGCPLEVLFKAYKETIVFKKIDCITKEEHVLEGVKNKLIYNGKEFVLHTCFKYKKYYYLHILELKDYQKTWWLQGDKND